MNPIYLDNAATTALHPEVLETMVEVMKSSFGNPSSTHSFGRSSKVLVENARKNIAKILGAQASEILFTSCGTESNNWVLTSALRDLGVKRVITTKIEHHAVLHTLEVLKTHYDFEIVFLKLDSDGKISLEELEMLLDSEIKTLVSLMHVNNEIGTVLPLQVVANLCVKYKALFHSDTVQSIGKIEFDLSQLNVDFIVGSAHKFHGPKGIGFLYVKKNSGLQPLIFGGEQEKGFRAGTEAVHQIVGMSKALTLASESLEKDQLHISKIKEYAMKQLEDNFNGVVFHGGTDNFYNILNISLPLSKDKTSMLLFVLDMKGIAASRGSACQSGSSRPSHVLEEILDDEMLQLPNLRLSFSSENTTSDIDFLIDVLKNI